MLLHHYKRHKLIFHKDLKIFKENKMTILFNFVTKSSSKFFFYIIRNVITVKFPLEHEELGLEDLYCSDCALYNYVQITICTP